MKQHVWKIFSFAGWFVTLIGVIFALLFATLAVGEALYGGILLIVMGAILVLIGELLLSQESHKKYSMIWHALSIGGAFALTIGIVWLIVQFLEIYTSWFSVVILLAIGIVLIIVGETIKVEKK